MKKLAYLLLPLTFYLFPASAQNFTMRVSMPQKYARGEQTMKFSVTKQTATEEADAGSFELKATADSMMVGEYQCTTDGIYLAGATWDLEPHVGFSFVMEPGTATATPDGYQFIVTGTESNDLLNKFKEETAASINPKHYSHVKSDSIAEAYMHKYADSPLFAYFFNSHTAISFAGFGMKDPEANKAEVERLWAIAGEKGRNVYMAKSAYDRICHNTLANGEPLRDVEIPNATVEGTGKTVRLSDYIGKGKWVFVDFWASWCGGCRQAIPLVKKAYEALKDKNVMFISIAEWDKRPAALKAQKEEDMPWFQLIDEKGKCGEKYMFTTIPRFMLFAPDGTLFDKDVDRRNIQKLLEDNVK